MTSHESRPPGGRWTRPIDDGTEPVEIVHWNPKRPVVRSHRLSKLVPFSRPVNNFGDLIGPLVVGLMLRTKGLARAGTCPGVHSRRLLTVGSILHLASTGDTVWGTGWNGKVPHEEHEFDDLDVRAVRGPRTRENLIARGVSCPEVYGDPALLLPILAPELFANLAQKRHEILVVPNLNDHSRSARRSSPFPVLNPRSSLQDCLSTIAASQLVVGSSLHAIVVAESLGIPARLIAAEAEHPLKYDDYFNGTGRDTPAIALSVRGAITLGGAPGLNWDPSPLMGAFPWDMWTEDRP